MRVEVYLLSIPLTRHRSIVARPHRVGDALQGHALPSHQVHQQGVSEALAESNPYPRTLHRTEPG
jgi:hypothetical protein